jgi:tetratricopeptide (TPR) repeat protein
LLARRATTADQRARIALSLGPVALVVGFACFQLAWWSLADASLLALLVATTAAVGTIPKSSRWLWSAGLGAVLIPGATVVLNQTRAEMRETVTENDVVALIERDVAYWLANQAGSRGGVVLAPPNLTTSLYFHGGLSGLGTPYWENKNGFAAAVRIAGATSPEEAQMLARKRNLTYIVIPSWDGFMDEYARLGSHQPDHSLIALLHQWLPPRWLRPVPYHLPKTPGFEGLSLVIFQVTDVQDNPTALSRLAEYFVEMGQIDQAILVSQALERLFPDDLGALVARSLAEQAAGNIAGAMNAVNKLPAYLARGDDDALAWDRRVSLAIALTEGKHFELAKEETKRCLAALDETDIRLLTTVSLYRLQVLTKSFGLEIADPRLRTLARELLPAELGEKL